MKVLFVCHRVPFPPQRGGKIRPFNIVKHLSERGHEVTVASLARTERERDEAGGLAQHCAKTLVDVIPDYIAWPRMVARLASSQPSSFGYFHSRHLARQIAAELAREDYELIFVHCSSMAPYVATHEAPLKVLDYGDMDSQKWLEYAQHRPFPLSTGYWLEGRKLQRTERRLAEHFDLCTCTTQAELQSLRQLGVNSPADWFPNGVNSDYFRPATDGYDANVVVFVGRMDYYPNQQAVTKFCTEVLPGLSAQRPEVRFEIVGANPPAHIRALARIRGVSVTGTVPDVRPYVTRAALSVAPLEIARGTQNKILESMAMGVPVVCSPQAAGGVNAVPGEHLLTAHDSQEYIAAILGILQSAPRRQALATAARARVMSSHTWAYSMSRLDELLSRAQRRSPESRVADAPRVAI